MIFSHITTEIGQVASISQTVPYQADPLACYQQLAADSPYSLLLESAEIDSKDNLKSLMLIDAALRIECQDQQVSITAISENGALLLPFIAQKLESQATIGGNNPLLINFKRPDPLLDEDSKLVAPHPFDVLRTLQQQLQNQSDEPFAVFLGGVIGYDMVATVEELPQVPTAENQCPDYLFYLAETVLVLDHQTQQSRLIGNIFCGDSAMANCFVVGKRLEQLSAALKQQPQFLPATATTNMATAAEVDITDADFVAQVEMLKHNIVAGDVFQVVPSRCFNLPCPCPLSAYARLKTQNPSPYMFFLKDPAFTLFGASPESALKFDAQSRQVEIYPIAGTRRRGFNAKGQIDRDLDSRIELELRQDEKEKAEHLMLVDLARNDVARISVPGSRYVKELLKVDRYSYVMHLVSRVVGTLKPQLDALHAYQACMNMGTLVGAPKVRAAELIRQVEGKRRGSYGGAVGYLAGNGDFDSCIVIRSAYANNGMAYIQAGAGVVFDSVAQAEADETRSKAQAVISAILAAGGAK
ncbi:MAG: anthranilate synthase component 1 [Gammaproteobacteria bacterium]|nr:anthranilate synthase component 1 [Gammaproteobacteria bacterium]MBU2223673.1 anthranilate synthase component 1 [Gammaproteobacteria bacterium]MBU2277639.1 anthranilate synthase component 1 [Gammaproteobacteria bacterium]MBU2425356.1 anthranilate synthase component 1 [Gammaproteobacteria bacterium]